MKMNILTHMVDKLEKVSIDIGVIANHNKFKLDEYKAKKQLFAINLTITIYSSYLLYIFTSKFFLQTL